MVGAVFKENGPRFIGLEFRKGCADDFCQFVVILFSHSPNGNMKVHGHNVELATNLVATNPVAFFKNVQRLLLMVVHVLVVRVVVFAYRFFLQINKV